MSKTVNTQNIRRYGRRDGGSNTAEDWASCKQLADEGVQGVFLVDVELYSNVVDGAKSDVCRRRAQHGRYLFCVCVCVCAAVISNK